MAATVDIIIKGIAICYRKGDFWKVIFPTDNCHTIKFTHKKDDDPESEPVALSLSTSPIAISAPDADEPQEIASSNFNVHVYDLTSSMMGTHPRIKKKTVTGKFVLMTISKARFSINRYLNDFPYPIPDLQDNEGNTTTISSVRIAHSVKATIKGGQVTVQSSVFGTPFKTDNDGTWTLIFDNDCDKIKPGKNDMDMFYEIIEEDASAPGGKAGRQFQIGKDGLNLTDAFRKTINGISPSLALDDETIKKLIDLLSEPPNFDMGKPCLVATVTDRTSIDNLP